MAREEVLMACLLDASDPTPCAVQDGLIAISDTGECVRCGASVACKLRDFVKAENKQKMPENVQTGWRAASADSLPDRHEWVIVSGKDRWNLRPFVCEARVRLVESQILGMTRGQYFAVIVDYWMPMPAPAAAVAAGIPESPQAECAALIGRTFDRMIDAAPCETMCRFAGVTSEPCSLCGKSWMSPDHQAPMFDPRTPR